jgi:hypothetical protein
MATNSMELSHSSDYFLANTKTSEQISKASMSKTSKYCVQNVQKLLQKIEKLQKNRKNPKKLKSQKKKIYLSQPPAAKKIRGPILSQKLGMRSRNL